MIVFGGAAKDKDQGGERWMVRGVKWHFQIRKERKVDEHGKFRQQVDAVRPSYGRSASYLNSILCKQAVFDKIGITNLATKETKLLLTVRINT